MCARKLLFFCASACLAESSRLLSECSRVFDEKMKGRKGPPLHNSGAKWKRGGKQPVVSRRYIRKHPVYQTQHSLYSFSTSFTSFTCSPFLQPTSSLLFSPCGDLCQPPPSERRSRTEARISVVTCERKQPGPWLNYGERGGVRNWERHWLHCVCEKGERARGRQRSGLNRAGCRLVAHFSCKVEEGSKLIRF